MIQDIYFKVSFQSCFSHSLHSLVKILFSQLEDKIHIFAPPCNVLHILVDLYKAAYIYIFIILHRLEKHAEYSKIL